MTDDEDGDSDTDIGDPKRASKRTKDNRHENDKLIAAFQSRCIRLRLHGTCLPNNYTIILRLPSIEITKRASARRRRNKQKPNRPLELDSDVDDQAQVPNLDTDTDEDPQTRVSNAYPGSTNDIWSVHQ